MPEMSSWSPANDESPPLRAAIVPHADALMYRAKQRGENAIEHAVVAPDRGERRALPVA
jgi:hypothetical protein